MPRSPRLLLSSLVLGALVLASCSANSSDSTNTAPATSETTEADQDGSPSDPVPDTTPDTTEPAPRPEGMEELPPELAAVITELSLTVEELRELEFLEDPKVKVVTTEELAELVRADLEENAEDLDTDAALYDVLGLVEPGTNLLNMYLDLYGEQVAGFYDTDTKELVVPIRAEQFSPLEKATIVHELTHALTDQHFDLGDQYDTLYDEQRYDEALAFQAVIEGDAVATELRYLQGLTFEEQQQLFEESLEADVTDLEAAPRFIQESLIFPYTAGREFVESVSDAGLAGVNAAYENPPISTEQIITPSDFQVDLPAPVELDLPAVDGYEIVYDSTWGELSFELMFNQVLGGRPEASDGWGGDRYITLFNGSDVVMAMVFVGDESEDAAEMTGALLDYVSEAMNVGEAVEENEATVFTGEDFALVDRQDDRVVFLVASDPSVGTDLTAALAQPTG